MHFKTDKDIQAQKNYYYGMQVENIASYHECKMAWIQSQFSFRRPLPNLFKFELDVVCKFILIFKCISRLRNKRKHRKKGHTSTCMLQATIGATGQAIVLS